MRVTSRRGASGSLIPRVRLTPVPYPCSPVPMGYRMASPLAPGTSRGGPAGPFVPGDLGVGLPQVERDDLEEPVMFVAEQPRDRELDEGGRLWVGVRRRGELDPGSQLADLVAVPQPA